MNLIPVQNDYLLQSENIQDEESLGLRPFFPNANLIDGNGTVITLKLTDIDKECLQTL